MSYSFADVKLLPNPSLTTYNTSDNLTSFLLEWSPPYLWPGKHIEYFNISVMNMSDCSITYHRVNASFDENVVSLALEFGYPTIVCTEFVFEINAVSGSEHLPSYRVTDKYEPRKYLFICKVRI